MSALSASTNFGPRGYICFSICDVMLLSQRLLLHPMIYGQGMITALNMSI